MQTTTLIITWNDSVYTQLISQLQLQVNWDIATTSLENSIIILAKTHSSEVIQTIIWNQVEIEKVICVDISHDFNSVEYKNWDVVIPNSIISWGNAAFLEYAPKWDYDLEKFNLVLNGTIWPKWESKEDFQVDLVDENIFHIIQNLQKNDLLTKTVVLRWTWENSLENMLAIFEMMI